MTLRLAITPGEPAGIGPDLLLKLAQGGSIHELIAITDPALLERRAKLLGLKIKLREPCGIVLAPGELAIDPVSFCSNTEPGILDPENAKGVLSAIKKATIGCLNNNYDALITGPINKASINKAGIPFSGHTEYLAELCNTPRVVMMLTSGELRVALATTHVPLSAVPGLLSAELLTETLNIVHSELRSKFAIDSPQIYVCGLNPHAGEDGYLGDEEIKVIQPAIKQLTDQGLSITGPLPADSIFTSDYLSKSDVIVAMYHDQGLPVLKYKGFGSAVNITLGLPIIRTSVDHGTAVDIAGSGQANIRSLSAAINCAVDMAGASSTGTWPGAQSGG
jgi:4-hydroxythreonine-4-phosphate dehydrogenase